jgi:transposase-like protein/transcription elongation factor Elf1
MARYKDYTKIELAAYDFTDDLYPEIRTPMRVYYEDFGCPRCGSKDVVRYGKYKNEQQWWCNTCGHKFADNEAVFHMKTPIKEVADALNDYYGGKSINSIRLGLQQQYNHKPSESTVYRWLVRFTNQAIELTKQCKPSVGDVWIADETVLKIGGKNIWFWDIIDSKTRFLLASVVSANRGTKEAKELMEKAQARAGKTPKIVLTDKLASYVDGIEQAFGADARHIQSKPFTCENSTNLIERFHGTLKDRTEVMRGLKSKDTANLILEGYLIYYNFMRPHIGLRGKTPAEKAGLNLPIRNWLDVVNEESKKYHIEIPKPVISPLGTIPTRVKIRPKRRSEHRRQVPRMSLAGRMR